MIKPLSDRVLVKMKKSEETTQSGIILQYILQIITLFFTQSFVLYLLCRIISVLAQWFATEIICRKKYHPILKNIAKLDVCTKNNVKKNIKAMFIHKMGQVLSSTVDSVVISAFVGVIALGKYSNYTMILSSMSGVIVLVFTSLTTVIGHLYVEENKSTSRDYFECFHLLNFVLGTVFFLGYYAVADNLIEILFSSELRISKDASLVITLNGFIHFMRFSVLTFRDATGTFYQDRWKPLIEGLVNLILSIILVKNIGMTGVIVATIATNLLICHVIEPYVLYKYAFSKTPKHFYLKNYCMMLAFAVVVCAMNRFLVVGTSAWKCLIVNGAISLLFSLTLSIFAILLDKKHAKRLIKILVKETT